MISHLFSQYGSRFTTGTSELLYDALLADASLAPFFENVYRGRSMDEAHKAYRITPYHFQRVASHLHDALLAAGISQADTDSILAEVAKLRASVVNASDTTD